MMRYARGAGWLTGLVLVVVVLPWPVWADYEAGQRAWKAGRHGEALTEWQAAAAAGDRRAMLTLGRVFAKGLGTPQNYVEAHKWFNLAASRGEAAALEERDAVAARMTPQQVAEAQTRAQAWQPIPQPGAVFRDCADCPEMVVVPAGTFMMGSPASEAGRDDDEGPLHGVTISQPFAVGVYEVTRGEFGRFVGATGYSTGDRCWTFENGRVDERSGRDWRNPGYKQGEREPVVCVSWEHAQTYVRWLSEETGQRYRLLSEAEWEYLAQGGTSTARYWGESEAGQCRYANGADAGTGLEWAVSCHDGYARTAPVGSYEANAFGLHDLLGNVWEWTQDCWNASYEGVPSDGRAWESGECRVRVLRGGSWYSKPVFLRSADRLRYAAGNRSGGHGFRLARTLTP